MNANQLSRVVGALAAGNLADNATGSLDDIDTQGWRELVLFLDTGTVVGDLTLTLSSAATAGGTPTTHASTAINIPATADDEGIVVRWLLTDAAIDRYVDINYEVGANTAGTFDVDAAAVVLFGPDDSENLPANADSYVYDGAAGTA